MKTFFTALLISLSISAGLVSGQWPHLKTTYGLVDGLGVSFDAQPRTQAELDVDNWQLLSSCQDSSSEFPGDRYVRSLDDNDMVLIFDGNGYIAGMQTLVPFDRALDDAYFPYSTSQYYQLSDFNGEPAYFVTIYFVDPLIICNGGRTEQEFQEQGTGDRILLQDGPTPLNTRKIELTMAEMQQDPFWYEHNCFLNMGYHFFNLNKDPQMSCDDIVPLQAVYDLAGNLNGFVFQHVALLDSERFERVNDQAITSIIQSPPTCIYDLVDTPGIHTMHTYVSDYHITCP